MGFISQIIIEENVREYCPYCKKKHNTEFKREFYGRTEYLTSSCPHCGHELWMRK